MKLKMGHGFILTTEHTASSYGIPVLLNGITGQVYGPTDLAPDTRPDLSISAKELVGYIYKNKPRTWRLRLSRPERDLLFKFGIASWMKEYRQPRTTRELR